jgi:predicted ester cyclase
MKHDLKALSREWFEEVWNKRSEPAIDRLASSDVLSYGLGADGKAARGLTVFRQFWKSFLSAFPDLKVTVEDVMREGDQTVIRMSFAGTHSGDGIGVKPTGRRFTSTALVWTRWRDGKIVEAWNEFDAAGMMRQLEEPSAKLRP